MIGWTPKKQRPPVESGPCLLMLRPERNTKRNFACLFALLHFNFQGNPPPTPNRVWFLLFYLFSGTLFRMVPRENWKKQTTWGGGAGPNPKKSQPWRLNPNIRISGGGAFPGSGRRGWSRSWSRASSDSCVSPRLEGDRHVMILMPSGFPWEKKNWHPFLVGSL